MSRPLARSLALLHRPEVLEHLDDAEELLPVRAAEGVERLPLLGEPALDALEALPGLVAAALRAPRAAVALDRGERAPPGPGSARARSARAPKARHLLGEPARRARSQSRGTCSGGVCQKTRLTLPSFICTVPPWGSSTWMRSRWRRRSHARG